MLSRNLPVYLQRMTIRINTDTSISGMSAAANAAPESILNTAMATAYLIQNYCLRP